MCVCVCACMWQLQLIFKLSRNTTSFLSFFLHTRSLSAAVSLYNDEEAYKSGFLKFLVQVETSQRFAQETGLVLPYRDRHGTKTIPRLLRQRLGHSASHTSHDATQKLKLHFRSLKMDLLENSFQGEDVRKLSALITGQASEDFWKNDAACVGVGRHLIGPY